MGITTLKIENFAGADATQRKFKRLFMFICRKNFGHRRRNIPMKGREVMKKKNARNVQEMCKACARNVQEMCKALNDPGCVDLG